MAINEPEFSLVSQSEHYEIRKYSETIVAETLIEDKFDNAGNKAFKILADYIFGNNKTKLKIDMTAPVAQQSVSQKIDMTAPVSQIKTSLGFLVQFTMPNNFTMQTLPVPNDPRVQLKIIPQRTVAVYRYSGSWSEDRYQQKLDFFKAELAKNNIKTIGEPVFARFNSPFQLWFLRRNEIWFEIAP